MRIIATARGRLLSRWARLHLEYLEDRTVPSTFVWSVDATSTWNNPNNWTLVSGSAGVGYPDAVGDSALFLNAITTNRTITIPNGVTISVGGLQIDDNNNYTIAAAGTGRLDIASSNDGVGIARLLVTNTLGNGAPTISAPITLFNTLEVTNQSSGVLTFSGAIGQGGILGNRGLFTDGTGTLRLSGNADNTYLGNTTVQKGTLELNKTPGVAAFGGNFIVGDGIGGGGDALFQHLQTDNIPDSSTMTVNADGTCFFNDHSETVGPFVVTGGFVAAGTGVLSVASLTMTGGTISTAGELNLRGNATINASTTGSTITGGHVQLGNTTRRFTVADGSPVVDLNLASEVRSQVLITPAGLIKDGPGGLRLGVASGTLAGATTLNAGTLLIGDNAALGTGRLVINGGTVQADGADRTLANALTFGGDFTVAGAPALTLNGPATLTGDRTITFNTGGLTTFGGVLADGGAGLALTKAGLSDLALSGTESNTYTGATTVADGGLLLNKSPGAAAFSGNLVVGDGAGPAGSAVVLHEQSNNILDSSTVTVNADGLYRLFGLSEAFGPLVVNGGAAEASSGILSFSTLNMTGGSVTATGAGEIQLNGDVTINASSAGSTISGGHVQMGNVTRTFTVADGDAAIDLDIISEIRGTAGFTKDGPGTLRLEGTTSNTYTGTTTVTAGTLELNETAAVAVPGDLTINGGTVRELAGDEIADPAAIAVNAAGTFDLNGQSDTVGAMTVTGGTVTTVGTSSGRLTAGNTSFNAAATLAMNLVDAATSDRITVAGTVAVGGALLLSLAAPLPNPTAITLIDNDLADAVAGTFTGFAQGAAVVVGGQSFIISYTGGTGNDVVLTRADPPRVTGTQINGGANQRSRVTDVAVTFSAQVTFATTPGAAFTLVRNSDMAAIAFTATANVVNGVTVVTLNNFTGTAAQFGSLADGRYTLTVLSAQVNAAGQALDGNGDGAPGDDYTFGDAQGLFRYYGDMNGDRRVDISDFGLFSLAFLQAPNYNAALDFNNDGRIDIADFGQFSVRYFTTLP